ncbi:NUDIX domain-containing protein [Kitasatospora sp. NPDC018058]|uniref:NUDIX domain-containing protein n=1 Tax=Kitasatospora sp. NPDC018058 TaxID=3364025 RepID=UPI0037BE6C55
MTQLDHTGRPAGTTPRTPGTDPLTLIVGVHLVLADDGTVLLGRRRNTRYAAGLWHLPAGHMERGEPVTRSMTREAEEELGITLVEDDLELVHTLHHLDADDGRGRLQLFFRAVADAYAGTTPVLGCSCGIWGCWPLLTVITTTAETVTWSSFRQPFREEWGELPMGPYVIARSAYAAAVTEPVHLVEDPLGLHGETTP